MSYETLLLIAALTIAAIAIYAWYRRRERIRRRERLQARFGDEYGYVARQHGDARKADESLERRVERVQRFELRDLSERSRRSFKRRWDEVQKHFVDVPAAAVRAGHELVLEVMTARGYPEADLERRIADMSVHHPDLVHHFREASAAARAAHESESSTEQLRQAVIHYRALFEDLLEPPPEAAAAYRGQLASADAL